MVWSHYPLPHYFILISERRLSFHPTVPAPSNCKTAFSGNWTATVPLGVTMEANPLSPLTAVSAFAGVGKHYAVKEE
jgi:hypothetical protein